MFTRVTALFTRVMAVLECRWWRRSNVNGGGVVRLMVVLFARVMVAVLHGGGDGDGEAVGVAAMVRMIG